MHTPKHGFGFNRPNHYFGCKKQKWIESLCLYEIKILDLQWFLHRLSWIDRSWESIFMEKRLLTLCSDALKLRNFQGIAKNKATIDAHGYALGKRSVYSCCVRIQFWMRTHDVFYIYMLFSLHIGVGFCVARSSDFGQCEGLRAWNEWQKESTPFS